MEEENNNVICPKCGEPFEKHNIAELAEMTAAGITNQEFPNIWSKKKQELKQMSKKELAEEMYFAGAFDMFSSFHGMIEKIKEEQDRYL